MSSTTPAPLEPGQSNLTPDGGVSLFNLAIVPTVRLFNDSERDSGGLINQEIASAIAGKRNGLRVIESWGDATTPVAMRSGFSLVGSGRVPTVNGGSPVYQGGVQLNLNVRNKSAVTCKGNPAAGLAGMMFDPEIENIRLTGSVPHAQAVASKDGPWCLLELQNCANVKLAGLRLFGVFAEAMRVTDVWDSNWYDLRGQGGFADPTQRVWTPEVGGYTGRDKFLDVETDVMGCSAGVAAFSFYSPNVDGGRDVNNQIRIYGLHAEPDFAGGPGLLIRGGNSNNIFLFGAKFECDQGISPNLVLQSLGGFHLHGYLHSIGSGTVPETFGGLTAGTPWRSYGVKAGLIAASGCSGLLLTGQHSHSDSPGAASIAGIYNLSQCEMIAAHNLIVGGLSKVERAWTILDRCDSVNHIHQAATSYAADVPGANLRLLEVTKPRGPLGHAQAAKFTTISAASYTPTLNDMGSTLYCTNAAGCVLTIDDLGAGVQLRPKQGLGAGIVTVVPGANVTFYPAKNVTATDGIGSSLALECHGDRTISVGV